MRVLVVGAGKNGTEVIKQLQKNEALHILTLDPSDEPLAVREGIIDQVDIQETLTPLTLEYVVLKAQPDLVLLTTSTQDLGLGKAPGMDMLGDALKAELVAIARVPIIEVARMKGA